MLIILTLLASVLGLTASAADTDPNMTGYNYQFTYIVDRASIPLLGSSSVDIYAVPADSSFNPTVFDTAAAAENVNWTRSGGSTWGIDKGDVSAYAIPGGYASCLTVELSGLIRPRRRARQLPRHEFVRRVCGYYRCCITERIQ